MTDTLQQDRAVARSGGLAGMLGSVVLMAVFIIVGVFVGADPTEPEGFLTRFPEVRTAHIFENTLYLAAIVLWILHLLALYRVLRSRRPTAALFGSALAIVGLVILAAGALPHLWQTPISELYHAAGTTAVEQDTLVIVWQATQGIFSALLITGLLIVPVGYLVLGTAMRRRPDLGSAGILAIGLGAIGLAAASLALVQDSIVAALAVFAMIIFHGVVGWRIQRL